MFMANTSRKRLPWLIAFSGVALTLGIAVLSW